MRYCRSVCKRRASSRGPRCRKRCRQLLCGVGSVRKRGVRRDAQIASAGSKHSQSIERLHLKRTSISRVLVINRPAQVVWTKVDERQIFRVLRRARACSREERGEKHGRYNRGYTRDESPTIQLDFYIFILLRKKITTSNSSKVHYSTLSACGKV